MREILDELICRSDVELIADPTQADADRYGPLLRHVHHEGHSVAKPATAAVNGVSASAPKAKSARLATSRVQRPEMGR